MLWATSRTRSICGRCFLKILDISKVYFIILSRYFTISYLSVFYHSILHIKIIYYFLPIIINNINSNKFKIQKPKKKRKKKKKKPQPTNKPEMKKCRPKLNQPTKLNQRLAENPSPTDPKPRPTTHTMPIQNADPKPTSKPISNLTPTTRLREIWRSAVRVVDVSGEGWSMRWRVVENEATRLAARTGVISGEDWRVILSNFLEQGGEERDKEW